MIPRDEIVGHRLIDVLSIDNDVADSINFSDFVFRTDNLRCFRMPSGNPGSGDLLPAVQLTDEYRPLVWPRGGRWHYGRQLWLAEIVDILVPTDISAREPDNAKIALSSGWYVFQMSGTPIGILPGVGVVERLDDDEPMTSIWSVAAD